MIRVRLGPLLPGGPRYNRHVFDAESGADLSPQFPIASARRLQRSLMTGRPVRLVLFRLDSTGHHYFAIDRRGRRRVAAEPATVLVVR